MPTETDLDQETFDAIRALVYQASGINLGPHKLTMVRARLSKRLRTLGLSDHRAYLALLREDSDEVIQLLDAVSTNVTSFFREAIHFGILADYLQGLHQAGQQRFRLWSAASSTGEEPYTIAMTVCETLGLPASDCKILATDISTRALAACRAGSYTAERVAAVPPALRQRYFIANKTEFQVRDELKRMVVPRRLDLSSPPFPMTGPLDVVFCRNVMIYFDNTVRSALLAEITRLLRPGGYLFVGHAESLAGQLSGLQCVRPTVYRKAPH
ncbi:MAG: protein-glutamate O-methyltransferase CheR [Planctomycetota bacterium]|nr:protein-glutamate O-methyltransferase CheR [Planctomycetota bacterium]